MFKLIAIDVDGTLINSNHELSEQNINAINKAVEMGIYVVVATGRCPTGVYKFLNRINFKDKESYIISHNGSIIVNAKTKELIPYSSLTGKEYKELQKIGKELGFKVYAFDRDACIADEFHIFAKEDVSHNEIEFRQINFEKLPDDHPVIRVLFSGEENYINDNLNKIPSELFERFTTMRSHKTLFEFLRKGNSKGAALKALAETLGIKREEVMCIGDAENDIYMMEYAGFSVAMGNAMDAVKKAANYVTKTNDESGVAYALEKFVLNEN